MRKTLFLLAALFIAVATHGAKDIKSLSSIVTVITTDKKGQTIGRSLGFVVPADTAHGNVVNVLAPYGLFKHAAAATATDRSGKRYPAKRISGANDLYDVVGFSLADDAKLSPLSIATAKLAKGDKAVVLTGITDKKKPVTEVTVEDASQFGGLTYYTLSNKADTALIGSPLLNKNDEVVGVIQKSATGEGDKMYAIGIEFWGALTISTISAADPSANNIYIPKLLPKDENQAKSYIYLFGTNSTDSVSLLANMGDYIAAFPTSSYGYARRAEFYLTQGKFQDAEADYNKALEVCDDKADVHYNMSTTFYHLNQRKAYKPYKDWTLERALDEANKAYEIQASPFFLMHKAKCLYALKRYMESYETYDGINKTEFRSAENLFAQSRSLEMAKGDTARILALLDSTVAMFPQPYKSDAAAYVYYRAQQYDRYGRHREAVFGYMDYQEIVGIKNLNDRFFYIKEQAEVKSDFYPQALADIERAIAVNPKESVYFIEKALIEVRMGNYEDAVYSAKKAQSLAPDDSDCYKLMGIAYGELGNKAEARKNLQKAFELGDEEAKNWLDNMKK